jgi:hypothetical protein
MNLDNVTSPTGKGGRADELGYFVMRFSEDDGRSVMFTVMVTEFFTN